MVEDNILDMTDRVMDILSTKYLVRPSRIKDCNALKDWDYSGTTIFLSVYDDRLMIWNPGELPSSLTVDLLKEKHSSQPRTD